MSTNVRDGRGPAESEARPREKRVRRRLSVGITVPGQGLIAGWTSNLALHGLSLGANRVFPPGTALKAVIQLPDSERATVEGVVTWSRKGIVGGMSAMGIKFSGESPQYLAFLKRFHPEVFRKG